MRLIDGDELLEFVEDRYEITWESDSYEGGIKDACTDIIEKIGTMPTIEPEQKKGKWKRTYLDHEAMGERPSILYCSECSQCIAYPTNYCPNCGAEMEV